MQHILNKSSFLLVVVIISHMYFSLTSSAPFSTQSSSAITTTSNGLNNDNNNNISSSSSEIVARADDGNATDIDELGENTTMISGDQRSEETPVTEVVTTVAVVAATESEERESTAEIGSTTEEEDEEDEEEKEEKEDRLFDSPADSQSRPDDHREIRCAAARLLEATQKDERVMAMTNRSVCKWRFDYDVDAGRIPEILMKAVCLEPNSTVGAALGATCHPLYYFLPVRRMNPNGSWRDDQHRVQVGCVLARSAPVTAPTVPTLPPYTNDPRPQTRSDD